MKQFTDAWEQWIDATCGTDCARDWFLVSAAPIGKATRGESLSVEERAIFVQNMESFRMSIVNLVALAAQPDYDAEVWDTPRGSLAGTHHVSIRTAATIALAQARILHAEDRTTEGLALATSLLPLIQHHRAGMVEYQLLTLALSNVISKAIAEMAIECDDTIAVRAALEAMGRVDARANAPFPDNLLAVHIVGNLRALKREGYPVEIDVRRPVSEMCLADLDASYRYPTWKLAQLPPDDTLHQEYADLLETPEFKNRPFALSGIARLPGPYGDIVRDAVLLKNPPPMAEDAVTLQKFAAARFQLARLALAERLAQLEGQPAPAAAADLVPRYLPTEPLDPFNSAPFRRTGDGVFFSVGPKGDEDAAVTDD